MCRVARIAYPDCRDKFGHFEEFEIIRPCPRSRRSEREILSWCRTNPTRRTYDPEFSCVRFEHELFYPARKCPDCTRRVARQAEKEVVGREVRFQSERTRPSRHTNIFERDVQRRYERVRSSGFGDTIKEKARSAYKDGTCSSCMKYVCVRGASLAVIVVGTHCLVEVVDKVCHPRES